MIKLRISVGKWLRCPRLALLVFSATVILATLFVASADAVPPPVPRELPGLPRGETETCWIAPYTLVTSFLVDGKAVTVVRWFDEKGDVARQLSGRGVDARTDYILERVSSSTMIHDVNGLWTLVVPKKPGPAGYITAVGDTFVHQFHPVEGQIAADVYVSGNLVGSVGPFTQYKGRDVRLADDGSWALLTWETSTKEEVQVVVFRTDGKVSYHADCGKDVDDPYPVGGGKGVLVRVVGREEPPVRFRYSQGGGSWLSHDIGPNAFPMASARDGTTVLFHTSVGERERFKLIDCASGKVLWEIPSPVQYYGGVVSSAVVVDDKLLFVGRDFVAVDIKSGELIARWQPNVLRSDRGRVARRGNRLFLVTSRKFTEINLSDIAAKKNGWR